MLKGFLFWIFIWYFQGKTSFTHTQINIVPSFFWNQRSFQRNFTFCFNFFCFIVIYLSSLKATSLQQNTFLSCIYCHLLARLEVLVLPHFKCSGLMQIFSFLARIFCRHYFCVSMVIWIQLSLNKGEKKAFHFRVTHMPKRLAQQNNM